MKVINVELKSSDDSEVVEGIMTLEKKVGDQWQKVDEWNVLSGTEEAKRQFLLEDDMRVVLEGVSDMMEVLDKEQMVVTRVPRDSGLKAELAKVEAEKADATAKENVAASQMAAQTRPPSPPLPPRPQGVSSGITPTSSGGSA